MWQYMPHYFKENSTLIPVVEEWLLKRLEKHDFIDPEVTYASIYVHTEKIKDLLLRKLPDATHSHWIFMGLLDGWPKDEYIKKTLKDYFRNEDPKKTSFAAHYGAEVFDDEKNEGIEILEEILFNTSLTFRERAIPALLKLDKSYFEEYILAKLINVIDSFPKDVFGQYYNVVDEIVRNFHEHPLVKAYVLKQTDELYFYTLFAKYYSDQHDALIKPLLKSTPMSKELRLLIIERLSGLEIPQKYIDRLAQFDKEEYSDVKADMALCLFTQLKNKDCERIINISDEMVFGKGFDFHILRNIAFCGFVLTHRLPEYFSKEEASHQSNPMDIFREYSHRDFSSNLISKTLVDEFEYLISTVGKDFKILIARQASQKLEDIWGFFAKNSVKSSPSFSYLLDYIQENVESITNPDIISFLSRVLPQSSTLKNILLRLVKDSEPRYKALIGRLLGSNFRTDKEVYEEAKLVKDYKDQGRIIALCTGWPNEPILEEIFHQAITNRFHVDDYVGFYLKFLFRDIDNLMRFLKDTFSHPAERIRYHKKFFRPLIERLKRDKDFSSAIKQQLLSTSLIEEKISYYNLLAQVDLVDEDVKQWKNQIDDFKNDYGYDIVSNRTIRLRDVLHDYYF